LFEVRFENVAGPRDHKVFWTLVTPYYIMKNILSKNIVTVEKMA
jgi:hypothetical protein